MTTPVSGLRCSTPNITRELAPDHTTSPTVLSSATFLLFRALIPAPASGELVTASIEPLSASSSKTASHSSLLPSGWSCPEPYRIRQRTSTQRNARTEGPHPLLTKTAAHNFQPRPDGPRSRLPHLHLADLGHRRQLTSPLTPQPACSLRLLSTEQQRQKHCHHRHAHRQRHLRKRPQPPFFALAGPPSGHPPR